MSDTASSYATIDLDELFEELIDDYQEIKALKQRGKTKILLVDDMEINQIVLSGYLENAGYSVDIADSGVDALMNIAKENYDLILSDIEMPNLNGFELLQYMKDKNIDIPVVFVTSHTSSEMEVNGLAMGAVEFLHKPIEPKLLLMKVSKVLNSI